VDGSQPSPRRRRKRSNRGLLLLGIVVAPLLLLAGLEFALRATGVGDLPAGQASKLSYQQVYPPMLEAGERPDGSAAWITNDARVPWQALDREKAEDTLRVVAVGGSATAGLGFSPNVTFARELERMLVAAQPDRPVEVLNLGIVALGSGQVRWIVDDVCRRLDPDVVLVYSGNNEFLEIHAQKFAAGSDQSGGGVAALLNDTNLFRLVGGLKRNAARGRNVTIFDMATAQARVSETEMMREVSLTHDEHAGVVDAYEQNLRAMVSVAQETDTELLLMTVASNWQWQGREDLPEGWIDELVAGASGSDAGLQAALAAVDLALPLADEHERHTWHFKRGVLLSKLERWGEAEAALREAMNADPRLRRATDELAERVRAVAADTRTPLLDTIALLAGWAEHGIVGDGEFYDYVHFTPRGCVLTAAALFEALREQGHVSPDAAFDLGAHASERLAWYEQLGSDPLAIDAWLGLGQLDLVHDRDLWKHQAHVRELDGLIEQLTPSKDDVDSSDAARLFDAMVRRGNAAFFMRDGYDEAERLYRSVSDLGGSTPVVSAARQNLERLRTTRRP
jgi:lysophospholipase L1-like esterase